MIERKLLEKKYKEVKKIIDDSKSSYHDLVGVYGIISYIEYFYPFAGLAHWESEEYYPVHDLLKKVHSCRFTLEKLLGDSRRNVSIFKNSDDTFKYPDCSSDYQFRKNFDVCEYFKKYFKKGECIEYKNDGGYFCKNFIEIARLDNKSEDDIILFFKNK